MASGLADEFEESWRQSRAEDSRLEDSGQCPLLWASLTFQTREISSFVSKLLQFSGRGLGGEVRTKGCILAYVTLTLAQ